MGKIWALPKLRTVKELLKRGISCLTTLVPGEGLEPTQAKAQPKTAQDEGKQVEEQFDFTRECETLGYIS